MCVSILKNVKDFSDFKIRSVEISKLPLVLSAISIEFSPFIHEIACSRKSKIVQECIRFPWGTRKVLNNSHRILKLFCNVRYKFSKRNILNYDLLLSSLQLLQWFMIIFCSKKISFYVNFIKLLQVTFN